MGSPGISGRPQEDRTGSLGLEGVEPVGGSCSAPENLSLMLILRSHGDSHMLGCGGHTSVQGRFRLGSRESETRGVL